MCSQVDGQVRSFPATEILPTAIGDDVELEFACRCRLRRRRGRRKHSSTEGNGSIEAATASAAVAAEEGALGLHPSSSGVGDTTGVRDSGLLLSGTAAAVGEEADGDDDEEEEEGRDAEPEATAKVRLRTAGGELVGEVWAELPGAPDDWARYPLYSPHVVGRTGNGARVSGGSGGSASGRSAKSTGLERGEVIPAVSANLRRRWGWGMSRRRNSARSSKLEVEAAAQSRRWFQPQRPRDVAGEVKLRLGWVPSGLAVTVHSYRGTRPTAGAVAVDAIGRSLQPIMGARPRRSLVIRAEPGGGSALAYPVQGQKSYASADLASITSDSADVSGGAKLDAGAVEGNRPRPPSLRPEVAGSPTVVETEDDSERFFYALNPACLLSGIGERNVVTTAGNVDVGIAGGGGGARLVLSIASAQNDTVCDGSDIEFDVDVDGNKAAIGASGTDRGEGSGEVVAQASSFPARAELLLFPGADPARRWVPLTSPDGDSVGEVDISVAWALAPPPPAPPTPSLSPRSDAADDSAALVDQEGRGSDAASPALTATASSRKDVNSPTGENTLARADTVGAPSVGLGSTSEPDAKGGKATAGVIKGEVHPTDGEARAAPASVAAAGEREVSREEFPEPAQVVSRCFSMHASDLVMRVSDLDVAVLVTMAKGIVRVRAHLSGVLVTKSWRASLQELCSLCLCKLHFSLTSMARMCYCLPVLVLFQFCKVLSRGAFVRLVVQGAYDTLPTFATQTLIFIMLMSTLPILTLA